MNVTTAFDYFFRKSPLVRALCWAAIVVILLAGSAAFSIKFNRKPVIEELNPPVGVPGEVITIRGHAFGSERSIGYVDFGGRHITESAYVLWQNDEIKLILPPDIQDSLVRVRTKYGYSKPAFFTNADAAPVAVPPEVPSDMPTISGISPTETAPGKLLIIKGENFGDAREISQVRFSAQQEGDARNPAQGAGGSESGFIFCDDANFDYEYWSDSEIRVRVPDGAASGTVCVQTSRGESAAYPVIIDDRAGTKRFLSPKIYLIQTAADIEQTENDSVTLRCPLPFRSAAQPLVQLAAQSQEPAVEDYQRTAVFRILGGQNNGKKKRFSQNFMIHVYEIQTRINPTKLEKYEGMSSKLYAKATQADRCVPSDAPEVRTLLFKIIKNERNPYAIASEVYQYMLSAFTLSEKEAARDPLNLLRSGRGDAYDFAVIFTALLRAAGIPALPDSGILIHSDLKTQNHWWSEFYLHGFGWVPVDPALGAGLEYRSWHKGLDTAAYYFGNLDAQHVLFSRGWNEIKPSSPQNKIIERYKTFALQSIWEEASGDAIKYSSYWAVPSVIGVY